METTWAAETHGDPLGTVNRLIRYIWEEAGLEGLFVSSNTLGEAGGGQSLLNHPEQLNTFNPFRPAMQVNTARFIPGILREKPTTRFGAVLRPCEIRTLSQLEKIDPFPRVQLLTLCLDCLGTFPAADIEWRTKRRESADGLAHDTLKFARQGGISVDRYRPACQVCRSPSAGGADINIWVIGLPARQYILIHAGQEDLIRQFQLMDFPLQAAPNDLLEMHRRVLSRVITRNHQTRERFLNDLVVLFPDNIDAIAIHLENCGECRECLEACPVCSTLHLARGTDGTYNRQEIAHWLASCAGCGMCEQACKQNLPLSAVFGRVHEQLHAMI